jgi:hypothetical protein
VAVEKTTADGGADRILMYRGRRYSFPFLPNRFPHHQVNPSRLQVHQVAGSENAGLAQCLKDVNLAVREDRFVTFSWHVPFAILTRMRR